MTTYTILEWICGGGLFGLPTDQIPQSLLDEGWGMLRALCEPLMQKPTDLRLLTALDCRLGLTFNAGGQDQLHIVPMNSSDRRSSPGSFTSWTIDSWIEIAAKSNQCLIVAPEIDGVLQSCISSMRRSGINLINCHGELLTMCCDKWLTYDYFARAQISAQPATFLASQFFMPDLRQTGGRWCIKPRLGAGCDGLEVLRASVLNDKIGSLLHSDQWIVQPWIDGQSYSRSAIVDITGQARWLPLVTQDLCLETTASGTWRPVYRGGRVLSQSTLGDQLEWLVQLLHELIDGYPGQILGWISFDLVQSIDGRWYLIEINPRLTTSFVGLSRALPQVNLAQILLQAGSTRLQASDGFADCQSVEFKVG
jgi:predicted ATP-grasp superfamily ATP-dependent carboligase